MIIVSGFGKHNLGLSVFSIILVCGTTDFILLACYKNKVVILNMWWDASNRIKGVII